MAKLENVKSQILETYKKWKENVKKFLLGESEDDHLNIWSYEENEKSPGRISLAIDNWRSTKGCEFLCITAHFIDSGWNFKKLIPNFVEVSVPLTVENLTESILRCISSWGIGEKIFSITLRNSATFEDTSLSLQKCLREKVRLPLDGMLFRVHCCSDILNKIVLEGLNEIAEIISKVREVSGDRTLQNQHIDKQWHRTYLLLIKAIKSRERCSASEVGYTDMLSMEEWKKLEGMCVVLKIFHDVTNVLSRTKQTIANICLHNVCVVRGLLAQQSTCSDSFVSSMASKMLGRLDKYWKDMFMVLAVGSVMGPRFRMNYLEYVLPKCDDIDSNAVISQVQEAVSDLYNEYVSKPTPVRNSPKKGFAHHSRVNVHNDFNEALLKEYHDFVQSPSTKSEWNQYVDDWTAYEHDGDALSWWGTYCDKYPTLSRMARDILAIPISVITNASSTSDKKPVIDTSAFFSEGRELDP